MITVTLSINENMIMTASNTLVGRDGDHNFTRFIVERPEALDGYTCRAEFRTRRTDGYILVDDDIFLLPNSLTQDRRLDLQLVYATDAGDIRGKTNTISLNIGSSINAVNEADTEFQDGIAQLQASSFAAVDYVNDTLSFYNRAGELRGSVTITGGGGSGTDGITPHIGDNGNWHIGDMDTGVPAQGPAGPQGESFDPSDILRIDTLETAVAGLERDNAAIREEITAKWILLNTIDNRSRANETSVAAMQSTVGILNETLEVRLNGG